MNKELLVTQERSHEFRPFFLLRDLAMIARKANSYPCKVSVRQGERCINAKNIFELSTLTLGAGQGVVFETWGVEARECLASLCRIAIRCVAIQEEIRRLDAALCLGPGNGLVPPQRLGPA